MDEDILRFRVGIFVLIAVCILGILIFLNSDTGWGAKYTVFVEADSAAGLMEQSPIRKYGVLIGRVKKVTPKDRHVLLELRINESELIFPDDVFSIGSESLLGDAGIEVLPRPRDTDVLPVTNQFRFENRAEIRDDPLKLLVDLQPQISDTLEVVRQAGTTIEETGKDISELSTTITSVFKDDDGELKLLLTNFRELSIEGKDALGNFNRFFNNVNVAVNEQSMAEIRQAIKEVPGIFFKISQTITDTQEMVKRYGEIPEDIQPSLDNIEAITTQLKKDSPEVLAQIDKSLKNADTLIAEVKQFAETLNEIDLNDGTVGKLLNDDSIHNAVLETARNIQETSTKLEPLINDLRMFADAIARNPGAIVKGAIRKGGNTNYKGTAGRDGGLLR